MILDVSYKEDMIEQIRQINESAIPAKTKSLFNKAVLLKDEELIERLWPLYQKSVQEYDVDPDYAILDALEELTHMPFHAQIGKNTSEIEQLILKNKNLCYEIYRREQRKYWLDDAKTHVNEWCEKNEDHQIDPEKINYECIVNLFEHDRDSEIAENVTWRSVVETYMHEYMGWRPDLTM